MWANNFKFLMSWVNQIAHFVSMVLGWAQTTLELIVINFLIVDGQNLGTNEKAQTHLFLE